MPHMVVATHGPETCAFPVQEVRDKALTALERMVGVAKELGTSVQGDLLLSRENVRVICSAILSV